MRAVVCNKSQLEGADVAASTPGKGQVLLDVLRCGICGSDLHARHHSDELAGVLAATGYEDFMRSHEHVVLGHEFCGTVAEYGPGCRSGLPSGSHVVALPLV